MHVHGHREIVRPGLVTGHWLPVPATLRDSKLDPSTVTVRKCGPLHCPTIGEEGAMGVRGEDERGRPGIEERWAAPDETHGPTGWIGKMFSILLI